MAVLNGPYAAKTLTSVAFSCAASTDPQGQALTCAWDFGDAASATGASVTHSYANAGAYTIKLTVTNTSGLSAAATSTANITAQAPVITTTGGPYVGNATLPISLSAAAQDPQGLALTYSWNFGDSSTATGATTTHTYASAGTYSITFTVTNTAGQSATATTTAVIGSLAPTAKPGGPYTAQASFPITLNGSASIDPRNQALTYAWDFGDGSTGTGAKPTHIFAKIGVTTITLKVTNTSALSDSASTTVTQTPLATGPHPNLRLRYLQNDVFYDVDGYQYAPPHLVAYDSVHKLFIASNTYRNELDIYDAATETQTGRVFVPTPFGIDVSPVDGSVYAGTLQGDLYRIDPVALKVVQRTHAAALGPLGAATGAFVLADGRIVLTVYRGATEIWDPTTNTFDMGPGGTGVCGTNPFGDVSISGDRTHVLAIPTGSQSPQPLCSYDTASRQEVRGNWSGVGVVRQILSTRDGKRIFVTAPTDGVGVFDGNTLAKVGQISTADAQGTATAVMSLDGSTLYLDPQNFAQITAWDTTTLALKGWAPKMTIADHPDEVEIGAIDETGLLFGEIGHGIGFEDAGKLYASQPRNLNPPAVTTLAGPLSGFTTLSDIGTFTPGSATVDQVWVGNGRIAAFSAVPQPLGYDDVQIVTPPSTWSGPVDLYASLTDNSVVLSPLAFSYGPSIFNVTTNASTADGGQAGVLEGFGFGTDAKQVQLTIGGTAASITQLDIAAPIIPFPYPVQVLHYTVPPGTAGSTQDIVVSTPAGTVTAKGAFQYIAASQPAPATGPFQQGIYDRKRDLYYFTASNNLQVYSRSQNKWLTPISLPGTTSSTSLLALSLSPNGSHLAVSDYGGLSVYVLDPDAPALARKFSTATSSFKNLAPSGLAITDAGAVYYSVVWLDGSSSIHFQKLDSTSGTITDAAGYVGSGTPGRYDRVVLSPDGSRILEATGQYYNIVLLSNDKSVAVTVRTSDPSVGYSGDGSTIVTPAAFADANGNFLVTCYRASYESWFLDGPYGVAVNGDGTLVYDPVTNGILISSRNSGKPLYQLAIPGSIADTTFDGLVTGPNGQMGLLTSAGVTFFNASTLTLPPGTGGAFPLVREGAVAYPSVLTNSTQIQGEAHRKHAGYMRGEDAKILP